MRIGLFGGTFDPPHLGHLILASECLHQLSLDRVFWILTPNPPHKQGKTISPLGDRLAMLEAALGMILHLPFRGLKLTALHLIMPSIRSKSLKRNFLVICCITCWVEIPCGTYPPGTIHNILWQLVMELA